MMPAGSLCTVPLHDAAVNLQTNVEPTGVLGPAGHTAPLHSPARVFELGCVR